MTSGFLLIANLVLGLRLGLQITQSANNLSRCRNAGLIVLVALLLFRPGPALLGTALTVIAISAIHMFLEGLAEM